MLPTQQDMQKLETLYNSRKYHDLELETKKLIKEYSNIATLYNILGIALQKKGDFQEAIKKFKKAITLDPKLIFAYNNLGNVYKDLDKYDDSIKYYEKAIKIKPDYAEAHYNQGCLYRDNKKYLEAIKKYELAIKINSDYPEAYNNLGYVLRNIGKLDEAIINYKKAIKLKPNFFEAYSNIFFTLFYFQKNDPQYYLSYANKFRSNIKILNKNLLVEYKFDKKPNKLKIGFISGDFKNSPVGFFLLGTLEKLKNKDLELFGYSNSLEKDQWTFKLKSHFDNWKEITNKNDIELINQIRNDRIHILIDLSGHSAKNRLPIFINKPAPIQVTWAGYAASTGIPEIDYLIGDSFVTPKEEKNHFSEKIFLLPNIWVCFTPPDFDIKINNLPAIQNKYITFGCFNNLSKINDTVISTWCKILKNTPNSKIFLRTKELSDLYLKKLIIEKFKANNINESSIILEGGCSRHELLKSYNKIDIALDPFPYSGGVTSFESIWMGVPVLTIKGSRFVSHTSESINNNSGMSDWVAKNSDDYLLKAIKFTSDLKKLSNIRENLRDKVLNSPSFNSLLFAKQLNEALWKMWNNYLLAKKR